MTSASLEGRVAVVTGAAQGIGYAVATHLTAAGAICELLDADTEAVRTAAAGLANASAWVCDVTNRQQVRDTIAAVETERGAIDILVNNAGIWRHTPVLEVNEADWDWIHAVNVKGMLFCSQAVAPDMSDRGRGKIVNIASLAGFTGSNAWSAYSASKAAAISLTLALASSLGSHGVHVNAVCPGAVETALTDQIRRAEPASTFEHALPPSEVAEVVFGLVAPFEQTTGGQVVPIGAPSSVLGIPVR